MNTKRATMMNMDQTEMMAGTVKDKTAMNCGMMSSPMMESGMMQDGTMRGMEMNGSMMSQTAMMMQTMRRRPVVVIAAVICLAGLWYLFRPELLFVDKTVNEAAPIMGNSMSGMVHAEGIFQSVAHDTKGMAAIIELANGKKVLRLSGFETSNGPDVHVLLGKAMDAMDSEMVMDAGHLDLGSLKGNIGDQNYDIPADAMLSDYNSVTIWCKRFNVNFGTAPLRMN